jgi:hypothetical protein
VRGASGQGGHGDARYQRQEGAFHFGSFLLILNRLLRGTWVASARAAGRPSYRLSWINIGPGRRFNPENRQKPNSR